MKRLFLMAGTVLFLTACNDAKSDTGATTTVTDSTKVASTDNSQEAKEERNKQVALACVHAFEATGNADSVLKDVTPDAVDYGTNGKPTHGIDSVKAGLKMWLSAIPDYKGSDFIAAADGDYVMVYGNWTGTWKNDLMGMKANGKTMKVADCDIFKFNDAGKIIEHRAVQSMHESERQLGMK